MDQPNVIFIIADQHRWDFQGGESNGTPHTPNLNRIAAAGTRFRTACCTAPLCSPSRAAIASGRYGMNTGCFTNLHELPPDTPTFVRQFRNSGYRTAVVGKTHMGIHAYNADYTSQAHRAFMHSLGWDDTCEISGNGMLRQGLQCHYSEYLKAQGMFDDVLKYYENWHYFMDRERGGDPSFVPHDWPLPEEYQEAAFVGSRALRWLESRDRARPYFLHVGFAGPHSPIEPSSAHMDRYRNSPETPPWHNDMPPEWLPDGRRGYRAMISQIDEWVGRIYDRIAADGECDNTIFVYTTDHGEMAGDHGCFGKTCFFEASPARLYDLEADPTECVDLAGDPAHGLLLREMLEKLLLRINQNTQSRPNRSRGEYRPLRSD